MRELISSIRGRMSHITAATLRRIAVSRGRDPIVWLIICGCLLVVAITLGTMTMVGEFRERAIANSERELQNAVLLLTRHFDQQFEDTEIIAGDIMAQMKIAEMATPEDFRAKMSSVGRPPDAEIQGQRAVLCRRCHDLRCRRSADQFVRVTLADACRQRLGAGLFQEIQDPIRSSETVLTEPVLSVFTGDWTTVIAHRLSGAGRHIPRRDGAPDRSGELREVLCLRRARAGLRDLDVPRRRHHAGALSACRGDDRQEIQVGAADPTRAGPRAACRRCG